MRTFRRLHRLRPVLVALYALAVMSSGLMPAAMPAQAQDLSAYALPGEPAPALCLTGDPHAPGSPDAHTPCAACRLMTAPGLADRPPSDPIARSERCVILAAGLDTLRPQAADIWPMSRGPPTPHA